MRYFYGTFLSALSLFFISLSPGSSPAFAQQHQTNNAESHDILNITELEAFMDGIIQAYMDKQKIAGATMGIMHNGETLLLKGYGYTDLENQIRVNPETSMFRIGSISKLFTWVAVLQQVEQGRLNLDKDINNYISAFSIPDTFDEPITLRSILSHTPGFEDILLELFIREDETMPSLEEIFKNKLPKRIMPPLKEASYSNHGTGLAQYLVEIVSDMPFEDYVEKYIFEPLDMRGTTFRQPIPEDLQAYMSNGYAFRNGRFEPQGFEVVPLAGAGGASTTAKDMLLFMDVLLNSAQKDSISLLDSSTYAIMKQPVIQHAPLMNPALHGFLDISLPHVQIIGHGGNTFLFHSLLALFPEHETGIFFSVNSENGSGTYADVLAQFVNRYFPNTDSPPEPVLLDTEYLKKISGKYIPNRRPHSDLLKVIGFLNIAEISLDDGSLFVQDMNGDLKKMTPVDSTSFYVASDDIYIAFDLSESGKAEKMYISNLPILAFDRLKMIYQPVIHLLLLALTIFVSLYILVAWPWIYFIRRKYDKTPRTPHPLPLFTKITAYVAALFFMVFLVMLIVSSGNGPDIIFGIPKAIHIALFFPLAAIPFIILMIWNSLVAWKTPNIRNMSRLFYSFATLLFALSIWQLHFWNLLGWNL
jgi:CubicO group peptidase (beta-lactamase class C family)